MHAALLGSLALAALAMPAHAATATKAAPAAKPAAAPAVPAVDPAATAALNRMGAYLRTLKDFEVTVYSTTEDVLDSGQKIMTNNQVHYIVQSPNMLAATVSGDKIKRHYYYDGKTFTVRNNQNDFYAQVPFTGTITQLLDEVEKYGVDLPLQDLFRWGSANGGVTPPTEGIVVGDSRVVDWDTDHFAFRQKGVDYQVWIEKGDKPLPRKLVINSLEDETQPQYTAVLNWNLAPKVDAAVFTFTPDAKAKRIPFMTPEAYAAATAAKKPAK